MSPSTSPSSSPAPTTSFQPSQNPTGQCWFVNINIVHDSFPEEISWTISSIGGVNEVNGTQGGAVLAEGYYFANDDESSSVDRVCLQEGNFEFIIRDSYGDGINDPGYYNLTSEGEIIVNGGGDDGFMWNETTLFAIPFLVKPSTQPTSSTIPTETTIPSQLPSFHPTQFVCESATSMKQCIKQPCRWDIENGTCVDARTTSPTTASPVTPFPSSWAPVMPFPSPWAQTPFPTEPPEQSSQNKLRMP